MQTHILKINLHKQTSIYAHEITLIKHNVSFKLVFKIFISENFCFLKFKIPTKYFKTI